MMKKMISDEKKMFKYIKVKVFKQTLFFTLYEIK